MKIDLDELERRAREHDERNWSPTSEQTLALIARIRELECALYSTIERHYTAGTIMGILEKGAVLPSPGYLYGDGDPAGPAIGVAADGCRSKVVLP